MDPRHPELAVSRIKELIKQYDDIEERMKQATTSAQLSQAEREGGLVIQEICLVAPRIHEAMMQASRNRRYDLNHGIIEPELIEDTAVVIGIDEATTQEAEIVEESKPKKKTTKKKSTKKKKADK